MTKAVLGVIGGSGVYDLRARGRARGADRVALGRDVGRAPHRPDRRTRRSCSCRAMAAATASRRPTSTTAPISTCMKRAGVTDSSRISACGSFKAELHPGLFVLVDQFIDRTFARESSSSAPAASRMCRWPIRSGRAAGAASPTAARGRGHRVSSAAAPMSAWKARNSRPMPNRSPTRASATTSIGMTNMPEAKLAREAEITYATVAMVTDYDCWHPTTTRSTSRPSSRWCRANAGKAARLVARIARDFPRRARALPDRLGPGARQRHHHRARTPAIQSLLPSSTPWRAGCCAERRGPQEAGKLAANYSAEAAVEGAMDLWNELSSPSEGRHPHHPGLSRSPGSCSATSPRCSATRAPSAAPSTSSCSPSPGQDRQGRRHRGARLHPRRRGRASALGRLRADAQEGQAAARDRAHRLLARIRHRPDGDPRRRHRPGRAGAARRRSDRHRRHRRSPPWICCARSAPKSSRPASSSTCPISAARSKLRESASKVRTLVGFEGH